MTPDMILDGLKTFCVAKMIVVPPLVEKHALRISKQYASQSEIMSVDYSLIEHDNGLSTIKITFVNEVHLKDELGGLQQLECEASFNEIKLERLN